MRVKLVTDAGAQEYPDITLKQLEWLMLKAKARTKLYVYDEVEEEWDYIDCWNPADVLRN
jgi:hypothetical protein